MKQCKVKVVRNVTYNGVSKETVNVTIIFDSKTAKI